MSSAPIPRFFLVKPIRANQPSGCTHYETLGFSNRPPLPGDPYSPDCAGHSPGLWSLGAVWECRHKFDGNPPRLPGVGLLGLARRDGVGTDAAAAGASSY